ncbi:hypothetical protein ACFLZZ_00390 [Nanoarchaeota archaeon]
MGKIAIGSGIIIIFLGLWLLIALISDNAPLIALIWPLVFIGTGMGLIILYKEEDKIERRKDLKERRTK